MQSNHPNDTPAADPDRWRPYLNEDEHILWEGRPARGLRLDSIRIRQLAFGALFLGVFAYLVLGPGRTRDDTLGAALSPTLGAALLLFGVVWTVAPVIWDVISRSRTYYAVTDKRALIGRGRRRRRVKSYVVGPGTEIDYRPGALADIYFAERRESVFAVSNLQALGFVKVGFRAIPDGDKVYHLLTGLQRRAGGSHH
ncbi:hypothetical protein [Bauldia sp.]|uniref:hypothetical protein n=1 Tax=Bauldia sp. TaxID=2575872 RepID=UPI003BAC6DED